MTTSILVLILLSLCLGLGYWLIFVWAARKGEFDDPEGPKYRMLEEDDRRPQRDRREASGDEAEGDGRGKRGEGPP